MSASVRFGGGGGTDQPDSGHPPVQVVVGMPVQDRADAVGSAQDPEHSPIEGVQLLQASHHRTLGSLAPSATGGRAGDVGRVMKGDDLHRVMPVAVQESAQLHELVLSNSAHGIAEPGRVAGIGGIDGEQAGQSAFQGPGPGKPRRLIEQSEGAPHLPDMVAGGMATNVEAADVVVAGQKADPAEEPLAVEAPMEVAPGGDVAAIGDVSGDDDGIGLLQLPTVFH